jgi:hypothetical protein
MSTCWRNAMFRFHKTTLAAMILAGSGLGVASLPAAAAPPAHFSSNHSLAPRVDDFDVQAVNRLRPGTPLRFTVQGTPGARTIVSIDGTQRSLLMTETSPGVYQGTYVVSRGDRIPDNARVTARLQRGDHVSTARLAEALENDRPMAASRMPEISRVTVTDEDRRGRGWMRFTVMGTPGAQATVQFTTDQAYNLELEEIDAGEYSALYRLPPGMALDTDTPLQARLQLGQRVASSSVANAYDNLSDRAMARGCRECGVVESVQRIQRGRGDADFEVVVRTRQGRQVVTYEGLPPFRVGDEVRVVGNTLERRQS